jgi:hypothetical protein
VATLILQLLRARCAGIKQISHLAFMTQPPTLRE